ncbi:MAG: aminopeptidase P family protein [Oscillospiraceae bacterium]|nr:aminopeptidase P family protein [Oscillospiraceae bacterium]
MTIHDMQNLCRSTMNYAASVIKPGMKLTEVRTLCEDYMLKNGADSFWYWDVGAFIFSGTDTVLSVSGREYTTPDAIVKDNDIVTIDLSPQCNNVWGDYARTIIVENGCVIASTEDISNDEWRAGLQMEKHLHKVMREYVTTETTFEELFYYMNDVIANREFANLDFLGNLGHSIIRNKNDRIYIEKGNNIKLSEVEAFTFEPHISRPNSVFGYKMENIYRIENGTLIEL